MLMVLAACSITEPEIDRTQVEKSLAGEPIEINGYLVRFDGRVHGDGETTFTYTVLPTEQAEPLQRFILEVPDGLDEPVSFDPGYGVLEYFSKFGFLGVVWRAEVAGNQEDPPAALPDSVFSVTYAGNVPLGIVQAAIGADYFYMAGPVSGPGVGRTVSGTVFVDTDRNGVRDHPTETGLPDVVVEIVSAGDIVGTATTGADGTWSATVPVAEVTVRIDLEAYPGAGNAALADYYDATTPLSYVLDPEDEETGIDFGFAPRTTEIVSAVETGALPSNGEDRKFWRAQFKRALVRAHRPNDHAVGMPQVYAEAELMAFVQAIQDLYFEDPYTFTPGRELREVYRILQFRPGNLVDELRQELLVTELNHVAHLGLWATNRQFQADIIGWGESVVIQETAAAADKAAIDLQRAIGVFKAINTGGGGAIDD